MEAETSTTCCVDTNCMEIKIARCDPYPMIEPQGYVVGFIIYCLKNGKSMYRDVLVSFVEMAKAEPPPPGTDEEDRDLIIDLAYAKIKDSVYSWYENISKTPVVLGSVYKPKQAK